MVDREYLAGLRKELKDATDPAKRDEIQAEIRRVGSGEHPSEPSQVEKTRDDRPVIDGGKQTPKKTAQPGK